MMAILSRSDRTAQAIDEHDGHAVANSKPPIQSHLSANGNRKYANNAIDTNLGQPPAKRRKLDTSHSQTTLDGFAGRRPPTKVTITEPHGQLVESLNGVQYKLNIRADDLPTTTIATPNTTPIPQQTSKQTKSAEKRMLRSQDDGPRLKSELAIYFPNYEDIILDAPQKSEFVTVDSAIYITDDTTKSETSPKKASSTARPGSSRKPNGAVPPRSPTTPSRPPSSRLSNSPRESLRMIARTLSENPDDPLTDEHFFKSHRRAERKEKQLRNIERERAMHEKVQLERLLDGLQGHDWLKVLGLTGITDGEAKKYEAKRDYFIEEVRALVDKFKQWKEQEKKQRAHKEGLVAAARGAESEEPESDESSVGPSSSELNASASRQLQMETANALKKLPKLKLTFKGQPILTTPSKPVLLPPSPEVPIKSFYDRKHLRDAALGKARHGRNATAFGHPVPDLDEKEFALPGNVMTEDFLRANARERRRRKRENTSNKTS